MTSRARAPFGLLVGIVGAAIAAACNTSSGPPLGGPHGGNGLSVAPNPGNYSTVDAAYTVPLPPAPPGQVPGMVNHWTHIYFAYLDKDRIGQCSKAGCHDQEMPNPAAAYQWLEDEGYVGSGQMGLTQVGPSCLSWFGGDMPPGGPKAADAMDAVTEMTAWATAGAANN